MMRTRRTRQNRPSPPAGFTLVEMLVVIGILVVLTVMTISLVNVTQDEDRVRAGAAQVQSYLEGARDRAIHAKEPRGVRFLLDTNNPNVATSLIYIGAPELHGDGDRLTLRRLPTSTSDEIVPQKGWDQLVNRGLIKKGSPLFIGQNENNISQFFTITLQAVPNPQPGQAQYRYFLTKFYPSGPNPAPQGYTEQLYYRIPLTPTVLPNQEPRQLPGGVVIDLNQSLVPDSWKESSGGYGTMDVLFSPNGTVTGLVASAGVIHLVVADQADVDRGFAVGVSQYDPDDSTGPEPPITREGNQRIVSLRTQTGGVSVHNVDPTDTDLSDTSNNVADDPFKYAALGEMAQ